MNGDDDDDPDEERDIEYYTVTRLLWASALARDAMRSWNASTAREAASTYVSRTRDRPYPMDLNESIIGAKVKMIVGKVDSLRFGSVPHSGLDYEIAYRRDFDDEDDDIAENDPNRRPLQFDHHDLYIKKFDEGMREFEGDHHFDHSEGSMMMGVIEEHLIGPTPSAAIEYLDSSAARIIEVEARNASMYAWRPPEPDYSASEAVQATGPKRQPDFSVDGAGQGTHPLERAMGPDPDPGMDATDRQPDPDLY